ncbi:MAG TPA: sigma-54 dependent transcriptional regulator [Terriglobia bacterium]|nr:sigma-54 dependent transcriptional regulator [Terriglobia bacterium]
MADSTQILVVEDDAKHGAMCARLLERRGYRAKATTSAREALSLLAQNGDIDLVLADLQMPEMDGIQLLSAVKGKYPHIEFIVMTGYGTVKTAVEAMQLGAAHYIQKPLDHDELNLLIKRAIEKKQLEERVDRLRAELQGKYSFENVIGKSAVMQTVQEKMAAACGNRATVLITGESGTGKELVARGIHYNTFGVAGPAGLQDADAPFVAVNCGALPKDLIESELFGYKKGAFTGAVSDSSGLFRAANGGTIFLDEIMEMSPDLQVKLMRVLQERSIRHLGDTREFSIQVRVIAATNKPLVESLESGAIRKDLYYRLSVITIHLPALRERAEDIPLLAEHFLKKHQKDFHKTMHGFEPRAIEAMMKYPWPGNVRELENLVEMMLAYGKSPVMRYSDLPERFVEIVPSQKKPSMMDDEVYTLKEGERMLIINALAKSRGNKSLAAQMLGISRKSLYKKLEDYAIPEN